MAAFDLNARLQHHRKGNRDAVWHTIGMAMLSLNMHVDAQRITIPFPSPDYDPPPRAA